MRPPSTLVHKGEEIEEWLDLHFFRPLGYQVARCSLPTAVTPDQLTLTCLLVGLVGGHLLVYRSVWINLGGFVLLVVSDVFDSADGQLARMRGTASRHGKVMDGIADSLRFINLYIHLMGRLWLSGWGGLGIALAAAAFCSNAAQSFAIEFMRTTYLALGRGKGALDLPGDRLLGEDTSRFGRFMAGSYAAYLRNQTRLLPRTAELARMLRGMDPRDSVRASYRTRQRPLLPHCAWLGHNIRFALVGLACMLGRPELYLLVVLVPMNLVLLLLLGLHEHRSAVLLAQLRHRVHRVSLREVVA